MVQQPRLEAEALTSMPAIDPSLLLFTTNPIAEDSSIDLLYETHVSLLLQTIILQTQSLDLE